AAPLPGWVLDNGRTGVHDAHGSYSAREGRQQPRSTLPVYARQLFPERLVGETVPTRGVTLWENAGVRLWHLPEQDAGIGILSFTSKMHTIGDEVLDGVLHAVEYSEQHLDGLVLWHEPPFAVGANL